MTEGKVISRLPVFTHESLALYTALRLLLVATLTVMLNLV
jgi:hypothetical protein